MPDEGPAASPAVPTSLSRELLRWIQSLDLAYSVKNVKRDFSNGFLIAEIFSRYYDKDIQMHSFDNGIALRIKKDNWGQLLKFMRKSGLAEMTSQEEVNAIIHCEDGAVINFLNRIYEVLTHRKVQEVVKRPLPDATPAYAKHTGSAVLRNTMRNSALSETDDEVTRQRRLHEKFGEHERSLQEERSIDPDRFSSQSQATNKGMARGPPRALGAATEPVPQVTVKEISVKQVDRNIAQLRATKEMGGQQGSPGQMSMPADFNSVPAMGGSPTSLPPIPAQRPAPGAGMGMAMDGGGGGGYSPQQQQGVASDGMSLLDACVARRLDAAAVGGGVEPAEGFCRALAAGEVAEPVGLQILSEFSTEAPGVAQACVGNPKQFWKVAALMADLMASLPAGSATFEAATRAFTALGDAVLVSDASTAMGLFCDYGMPKLLPAFKSSPPKREAILRVLYSFSPADVASHTQCLKRLQTLLGSMPLFLHAVALCVDMEAEFTSGPNGSLDLYIYYCEMGLGQPSPALRAAACSMLPALLPHMDPESVASFIPTLQRLSTEDRWWGTRAALLKVAAVLMDSADPATVQVGVGFVNLHFHPRAAASVQKVGVMALAKHASNGYPEILPKLLQVLLGLPPAERLLLVGAADLPAAAGSIEPGAAEPAPNGPPLSSIMADTDALALARALKDEVLASQLENLEVAHMAVLCSCVVAHLSTSAELDQQWTEVFDALHDLVFVALCDPYAAALAATVIEQFAFTSQIKDGILRDPSFVGALRLLFPASDEAAEEMGEGDDVCQALCGAMLRNLAGEGAVFRDAVRDLLSQFVTAPGSLLADVAAEL